MLFFRFRSWIRTLRSGKAKVRSGVRTGRAGVKLLLEGLEERFLPAVSLNLTVPPTSSQGVTNTLAIEYTNTGTTAAPAPVVVLSADNANLWLPSDPAISGTSLQVLATNPNGPAGTLAPGASGTIVVDFTPTTTTDNSPINFSLGQMTSGQTIDWASLESSMQPGTIPSNAWPAVFANFTTNVGSTTDSYQAALDTDATYLAQLGEPTNDVAQLLTYEINKANDSLGSTPLGDTVDAGLPTPGGLSLSFERWFQPGIAGRYEMGTLGLGWANNWAIAASTDASGNVAINESGAFRYFTLQPTGSYLSAWGDNAVLTKLTGGGYQLAEQDGSSTAFNTDGTLNYLQDINGNRITASYSNGLLAKLTASNGSFLTLSYTNGLLTKVADSTGQSTTYQYDATGQYLLSSTDEFGSTTYSYVSGQGAASQNALASIAYADNTHDYFGYDSEGRLTDEHQDKNQQDVKISYLAAGGITTTDANGKQSTVMLDDNGQVCEISDGLGNVTRYSYDLTGNLTAVNGPQGDHWAYTYDLNGNCTSATSPSGLTTQFTYNSTGALTSFTDAKGNTTQYAYDSADNLLSTTYANGTLEQYKNYNAIGEAAQYIDANGQATSYQYNAAGLVTAETFSDATTYSYQYDARGNLQQASGPNGQITFLYQDSAHPDRVTEVEYPNGQFLKFTYNTLNQQTQTVDQTGFATNYSYDALGRLQQLTDGNGNLIASYVYDAAGNLIQQDNGNGTFTAYTYDGNGSVLTITNYAPSTGGSSYNPAASAANSFDIYTYDALGQALTDTNQDGKWVYTYDADGQLTQAVFTPNNTNPDGLAAQNLQYVYDAAGNRISQTVNGVTTTYVVNKVNEYTSSVTNGVTTTYGYDNNGNLLSQTTGGSMTSFSYNKLNELTGVNGTGMAASYSYDALGNRIAQTVNGTTTRFLVGPDGVQSTYTGSGSLVAHYTYGAGLTSQVDAAGHAAYYDFNLTGNTIGMTGAAGSYVNKYAYQPFGQTTTLSASLTNPFTFVGQFGVMQDGANLFHMQAREFSPVTGQFLSNDPTGLAGGDTNIRRYVGNNPVVLIDPTGLQEVDTRVPVQTDEEARQYQRDTLGGAGTYRSFGNSPNSLQRPVLPKNGFDDQNVPILDQHDLQQNKSYVNNHSFNQSHVTQRAKPAQAQRAGNGQLGSDGKMYYPGKDGYVHFPHNVHLVVQSTRKVRNNGGKPQTQYQQKATNQATNGHTNQGGSGRTNTNPPIHYSPAPPARGSFNGDEILMNTPQTDGPVQLGTYRPFDPLTTLADLIPTVFNNDDSDPNDDSDNGDDINATVSGMQIVQVAADLFGLFADIALPANAQPGSYELAESMKDTRDNSVVAWQLPQIVYNPNQAAATTDAYGTVLQATGPLESDPPLVTIDTTDPTIVSASQVTVTPESSINPAVPIPVITGTTLTQLPNGVTQIVVNGVVSAAQPGSGPVATVPLEITLGNEAPIEAQVVLDETTSAYTLNPVMLQATQGQPVRNVQVALLAGPVDGAYAATINWGDGDTSTGQITPLGGDEFAVAGSKPTPYATAGLNSITVTVTGPGSTPAAPVVSTVAVSPLQLALGGLSQSQWIVNQFGYSATIPVTGGTRNYTNLQVSGLPAGLTASLSGSAITISGTPTQVGTFNNIAVSLQDSAGEQGSRTCSLTIGAAVSYLVDSKGELFTVDVPSGQTQFVAQTSPMFLDIALSPAGLLYGVSNGNLYQINTTTGASTSIGLMIDPATGFDIDYGANAMEFRADGTLFVAARQSIYQVNPQTAAATHVLDLPNGESPAGDLVFDSQNDLFLSTMDGSLVEANPSLTSASIVGVTGALKVNDINGLVYGNGTLFGLGDSEDNIYQINTTTGATTLLAGLDAANDKRPQGVYGTATLPVAVNVGVSLSLSTVQAGAATVQVGGSTTVTLTAFGTDGKPQTSGGLSVGFALGNGSAGGTFSAVTDIGNGTYTATFTATGVGSDAIIATIGGQSVTSTSPLLNVAGAPSGTITTQTPTFAWASVPGAASYDLWIADRNSGAVVNLSGLTGTTHTLAGYQALTPGHAFTWWAGAVNSQGTINWGNAQYFSIAPLAAPIPAGPGGSVSTPTPTFTWTAVAGADHYYLWLSDLTTGQGQVASQPYLSGTSFTPSGAQALTPGHSYIWWVGAVSANGQVTSWSTGQTFSVAALAAPILSGPGRAITTQLPTFSWNSVVGADHYDLWLDDQTSGQSQVVRQPYVTGTSLTLGAGQALTIGDSYQWWVAAVSSNGQTETWSAGQSFSVAAVVALGPGGSITTATPTFSWSTLTPADHFDLWVNDATTGQAQVVRISNASGTSLTLPAGQALTFGHSYVWWIGAVSVTGQTTWSAAQSFTVAALVGLAPGSTIATQTPTFTWASATAADHYDLWVDDITTGQSQVVRVQNAMGTSLTLTAAQALTPGDSFQWWIGAVSASGQTTWSSAQVFTIAALAAPSVIGPDATLTTVTPTFTWTAVTGADHYDLYVDDLTTGRTQVVRVNVAGTSLTLTAAQALTSGDHYRWWVAAVSTNGLAEIWSDAQFFVVAS